MLVMFVGPQGVPLAGKFIYPGETREVSEAQLLSAVQAHPGWFEVEGVPLTPALSQGEREIEARWKDAVESDGVSLPSPIEPVLEHGDGVIFGYEPPSQPSPAEAGEGVEAEVADVSSVEHVDQPVAKRRGGKKQRSE